MHLSILPLFERVFDLSIAREIAQLNDNKSNQQKDQLSSELDEFLVVDHGKQYSVATPEKEGTRLVCVQ